MNEQITKLIIEANKYATEKHPIADDADSITKEIIVGNRIGEAQRKLSKLIVAECMEVFSKDLPEPGDGKMLEVINRVCNVAEHFGVAE